MPKHTTPQPLEIAGDLRLQYHPLSGFGCADYVEDYVGLLENSGALDVLKYGTAELSLDGDKLDLAGIAALLSAGAAALTKSAKDAKTLRTLVVDHCKRFKVQVFDEDKADWLDLDTAERIDETLDFGTMLEVVYALAGGVLRPLLSRLRSSGKASRSESPQPLPSSTPES